MLRKFASGAAVAVFALLLIFAPVTARETSATPALWKIDGPAGDIYLFGSIHILPKGLKWRRPELEAALQQAEKLVFEVDLDEAKNPAAMIGLITKHGFLPPDQSLHKMLAPDYRAKLDEVATSLGLPPAQVDRMRPWLAAITLSTMSLMKQTNKGAPIKPGAALEELAGVDAQLWDWAKGAGKERATLETTEDQIRIFADLPHDQQIELLVSTLKEVSKPPPSLDRLFRAWKEGDVATLDVALNSEVSAFPALHKAVFHDRHEKWLPQIERMMADGRTHVVIVGTAHLVGKGSVIDMLRAKGVKVEGP